MQRELQGVKEILENISKIINIFTHESKHNLNLYLPIHNKYKIYEYVSLRGFVGSSRLTFF